MLKPRIIKPKLSKYPYSPQISSNLPNINQDSKEVQKKKFYHILYTALAFSTILKIAHPTNYCCGCNSCLSVTFLFTVQT